MASARWVHSIKLSMLNPDGQTVVTGKTPTLTAGASQEVVIARRQANGGRGLSSRFVTLSQVSANNQWPIKKARWLEGVGEKEVGFRVSLADGSNDTILASNAPQPKVLTPKAKLVGKRGFIRRGVDETVTAAMLSEGTLLEADDFAIRLARAAWEGKVVQVSPREIRVDTQLPPNAVLRDQGVMFSSSQGARVPYASNEFFTIESSQTDSGGTTFTFERQAVSSGRIQVERKLGNGLLSTVWPNELASLPSRQKDTSHVFKGHLLMKEEGARPTGIIQEYVSKNLLKVDRGDAFEPGQFYRIMATQPGDRMRIPCLVVVTQLNQDEWNVHANADVELKLPNVKEGRYALSRSEGDPVPLKVTTDGFVQIPVALLAEGEGKIITLRADASLAKETPN